MKRSYKNIVEMIIGQSDIILEVLDSRLIDLSRNKYFENKIIKNNKILFYVINKSDLVNLRYLLKKRKEIENCYIVSCKKKYGIDLLRKKLISIARKLEKEKVFIGIIGYPNTGKSSLINALIRDSKTRTSPVSGFTKGFQYIKLRRGIYLIDTPGVYTLNDEFLLALMSAKDWDKISDPELIAIKMIELLKPFIIRTYEVKEKESSEMLKEITLKYNYLRKNNEPDLIRGAKKIIRDWQQGKIYIYDYNLLDNLIKRLKNDWN